MDYGCLNKNGSETCTFATQNVTCRQSLKFKVLVMRPIDIDT